MHPDMAGAGTSLGPRDDSREAAVSAVTEPRAKGHAAPGGTRSSTHDLRQLTPAASLPMLVSMGKRILILDGSLDRTVYRPVEQWARHLDGVPFDAIHLPSDELVPPLSRYTHVLLTGSEASFEEPLAWFDVEADIVRDAVNRGLAVLGSCFGHQMVVRLGSERRVQSAGDPLRGSPRMGDPTAPRDLTKRGQTPHGIGDHEVPGAHPADPPGAERARPRRSRHAAAD
jgi:hypothetical protein